MSRMTTRCCLRPWPRPRRGAWQSSRGDDSIIMGLNSPAGLEGLQLRATTFNCTAAGQARELLQSSQAHVIMMQEIKMDYMAICDFTAWCSA